MGDFLSLNKNIIYRIKLYRKRLKKDELENSPFAILPIRFI